nr:MAG TPA: hypothetical protein [Caudoviricetes sp.]
MPSAIHSAQTLEQRNTRVELRFITPPNAHEQYVHVKLRLCLRPKPHIRSF